MSSTYVVIVNSNSGKSYVHHGGFESREAAEDYAQFNCDERGCTWKVALLLPAIDYRKIPGSH